MVNVILHLAGGNGVQMKFHDKRKWKLKAPVNGHERNKQLSTANC